MRYASGRLYADWVKAVDAEAKQAFNRGENGNKFAVKIVEAA